jgi:hypothetical protein
MITIVVPLPFWHKLNYSSCIQNFENLFLIYIKILIKSKISLLRFEPWTSKDRVLTFHWSKHIRLFHSIGYIAFIR